VGTVGTVGMVGAGVVVVGMVVGPGATGVPAAPAAPGRAVVGPGATVPALPEGGEGAPLATACEAAEVLHCEMQRQQPSWK